MSDRSDVMGYGDPYGHLQLRRAIASHLRANRGIGCDAEQIFVLDGGSIAGIGTHPELMAGCQAYQEIIASQLGWGAAA